VEYNPLVGAPAGECRRAGDEVGVHFSVEIVFLKVARKEKMVEYFVVEFGWEKWCEIFGRREVVGFLLRLLS
jgi:hypothetical protein